MAVSSALPRGTCSNIRRLPMTLEHNPRSTAQIAGHPIHPMLVPFPIAFFVSAFLVNLAYWVTGGGGWARASLWLLGAGVVMALTAAVFGLTDFLASREIRSLNAAVQHMIGNVLAVLISLANFIYQLTGGPSVILPWGLVMALVVV